MSDVNARAKSAAATLISSSQSTCEALLTLAAALSDHMAETTADGEDDCPVQSAILDGIRRLVGQHLKAEQDVM